MPNEPEPFILMNMKRQMKEGVQKAILYTVIYFPVILTLAGTLAAGKVAYSSDYAAARDCIKEGNTPAQCEEKFK